MPDMISKYVPLPKEDTYELIKLAKNGDKEAKERIVLQNTGLVKSIALRFVQRGYELDDLLQIGYIGLLKAVERFDSSYNVMFSTYAVPMILGEIKRYIRDDGRIKVSRQLKQNIRRLAVLQDEYLNRTGEYPRLSTLAELMEISMDELLEIMAARDAVAGIDSIDNPETSYAYSLSEIYNIDENEEKKVNLIFLKSEIMNLAENERRIIVMRYFMDMTQTQIAEKLGISQVQVSRTEKKILMKLRGKIAE